MSAVCRQMHPEQHRILHRTRKRYRTCLGLLLSFALGCSVGTAPCVAAEHEKHSSGTIDFTEYSLEELIDYEVTSTARSPRKLSHTASAIFVITQEDIRRSGFTTLPDLFRMVPGMQVARTDPGDFAVSVRGFLGEFANKLLVLVDGRTIYSPLFSGVFWDYRDMMLENIERIEVIRGPGASLWGSNAVNGVINIITKDAAETQGAYATMAAGNTHEWYTGLRYGGKAGENLYYRVYAKFMQFDMVDNPRQNDPEYYRGGFRIDWKPSPADKFLFSGEMYRGRETSMTMRPLILDEPQNVLVKGEGYLKGYNLLGRWTHQFSDGSETVLQTYFDAGYHKASREAFDRRAQYNSDLERDVQDIHILDVDFQHRFVPFRRHEIVWGLGFRIHQDYKRDQNVFYELDPTKRYTHIYSGFVHDEIVVLPERLTLIAGSKFEYNSYTDFEVQPTVRLMWHPAKRYTVWAAISRAVRIPSRYEHDGSIRLAVADFPRPFKNGLALWQGDDGFDSEELIAYELGARFNPTPFFSLDATAFYNVYNDLRTIEPAGAAFEPGYLLMTNINDNKMDGRTYGMEVAANVQLLGWWRLQATFTWLQINLDPDSDSRSSDPTADEYLSPGTQFTVRSLMDITHRLELDTSIYVTDEIPGYGIKRYANLSVRLGWTPTDYLDLSLIGHNLLDNTHNEFTDEIY